LAINEKKTAYFREQFPGWYLMIKMDENKIGGI